MYDVFSLPAITFPKDFLWGSATAGHQIEGDNIHSQNWHSEHQKSFWKTDPQHNIRAVSGKACDSYRLYREDVDLLCELGHKAYRMSIEWSRIEPAEGRWDVKAVKHYVDLLELLKQRHIKAFVTLHHFTHPYWFEKKGSFKKKDNLKYVERYLKYILPKIAGYVDGWIVINEFNIWNWMSLPPQEIGAYKFNMLRFHAMGYRMIKSLSSAPVSSAHAYLLPFPYRSNDVLDRLMTDYMDMMMNEFFFHAIRTGELVYPNVDAEYDSEVRGSADYWAVNYYTRFVVNARKADLRGPRFKHKELKMIPMDFYMEEFYPEGLTSCLERLADKPVYITENGTSATDDRFRIVCIALHLSALKDALDRGVDVRGYFHWSLMDNYEWCSFIPQFGLVGVDFKTFKRTPKPSAMFYRDIIRANGFGGTTVSRHLKELPTLQTI